MSSFHTVQDFTDRISKITTVNDFESNFDSVIRELGFSYYTLISHIDLATDLGIGLSTYPPAWIEEVLSEKYYVNDPVLLATERSITPFFWSDLPSIVHLTRKHKRILTAARRAGVEKGMTTPIHIPGEVSASVSFATHANTEPDKGVLPAAYAIAVFGFDKARRLNNRRPRDITPVQLTSRQLDVISLIAVGKSEWDIAKILGLSPSTIHTHVEDAKSRYNVKTRTQLVVHAIFDGHLTFRDVLKPKYGTTITLKR